jgi:predicted nucleic acid-binding protein
LGLSRIFFDTNLFIYLLEDFGALSQKTNDVFERIVERQDELVTSTLTVGEVLVKPIAMGDLDWANRYEKLLDTPGVTVVPFDRPAARIFAQIRQDRTLRPPDAIQLACAAHARCDLFITNDDRLSRRVIPGLQFITSLERAFL